jgi:hypothetical protein
MDDGSDEFRCWARSARPGAAQRSVQPSARVNRAIGSHPSPSDHTARTWCEMAMLLAVVMVACASGAFAQTPKQGPRGRRGQRYDCGGRRVAPRNAAAREGLCRSAAGRTRAAFRSSSRTCLPARTGCLSSSPTPTTTYLTTASSNSWFQTLASGRGQRMQLTHDRTGPPRSS